MSTLIFGINKKKKSLLGTVCSFFLSLEINPNKSCDDISITNLEQIRKIRKM